MSGMAQPILYSECCSQTPQLIAVQREEQEAECQPSNSNETDVEDCTDSKADFAHDRRGIARQISRALWRAGTDLPCAGACEPDRRTHGLQRWLGDASRYRLLCLGWHLSSKRSQTVGLFRKFFREHRNRFAKR